jgi:hypothetical protein
MSEVARSRSMLLSCPFAGKVAENVEHLIDLFARNVCPTCGTARFDYGYFKIAPAGRALLAFADEARP